MPKCKVIFLFSGLPHYFNFVLNALNKKFEVIVIIPDDGKENIGQGVYEAQDGIEFMVIRQPISRKWYGKVSFSYLSRTIKQLDPQILIFSWPYTLDLIFNPSFLFLIKKKRIKIGLKEIPYQVPRLLNIPSSIIKGYKNENNRIAPFPIRLINGFTLAICRIIYYRIIDFYLLYTDEGADILATYGVKRKNIFVTYNSIKTKEITKMTLSSTLKNDNIVYIHVGRLVKWKNVDLLINTFDEINQNVDPNTELWIVGDGPEIESLSTLANCKKSSSKIRFWGAKYGLELYQILNDADIYVLAGAGGLSINEAMCLGKPIICTQADGTEKMLVQNHLNGFIFDNNSQISLYWAMSYFLRNPNDIKLFGRKSLHLIETKINEEVVINNYVQAISVQSI